MRQSIHLSFFTLELTFLTAITMMNFVRIKKGDNTLPKAVTYKAGSIIYFDNDKSRNIYILKSGKIVLTYQDIHDGREIEEYVKEGEFFGLKDTLIKSPREETATVLEDCTVVQFTEEEFEDFVLKRPDIIMKMLKIYSKQLRVIHSEVQNFISNFNVIFPEEGLLRAGEYYFKTGKYNQAGYVFNRYKKHYPGGAYSDLIEEKLAALGRIPADKKVTESVYHKPAAIIKTGSTGVSAPDSTFNDALFNYEHEKYEKAMNGFLSVIKSNDRANMIQAEFRVGCCLYNLRRPDDAIKHLTNLLRKYPKHPELGEILVYLGLSYKDLNMFDKSEGFLKKARSILPSESRLKAITEKSLRELSGRRG